MKRMLIMFLMVICVTHAAAQMLYNPNDERFKNLYLEKVQADYKVQKEEFELCGRRGPLTPTPRGWRKRSSRQPSLSPGEVTGRFGRASIPIRVCDGDGAGPARWIKLGKEESEDLSALRQRKPDS